MRKFILILVAGSVLPALALGQGQRTLAPSTAILVDRCKVTTLSQDGEALVPAQEAGVLTKICTKEMEQVKKNALLANIDDAMSQKQLQNATAEYNAAKQKAETDVDERVAFAAWKAADFEYKTNLDAVQGKRGVAGAVSATELEHFKFNAEHMRLAIEQAQKQQIENRYMRDAKQAEMESAQEQINRREVKAPFAGVVQHITQHLGEWVKPGDPVVKIIRMDKLRVEGYLKISEHNPNDVIDRPVKVKVSLAGGHDVVCNGKIVFVDPEILSREFAIWAEIENQQDRSGKDWLLRPGMEAKMEIQMQ